MASCSWYLTKKDLDKKMVKITVDLEGVNDKAEGWVKSLDTKNLADITPLFMKLYDLLREELFSRIDLLQTADVSEE